MSLVIQSLAAFTVPVLAVLAGCGGDSGADTPTVALDFQPTQPPLPQGIGGYSRKGPGGEGILGINVGANKDATDRTLNRPTAPGASDRDVSTAGASALSTDRSIHCVPDPR